MMFNVPQFIDVEDKIAGPLTWRQLLWMIGMGAVLLVIYNTVPTPVFFVLGIPIVGLFVALAFYRPHNQPLVVYVLYAFMFLFRPKVAVWERPDNRPAPKAEEPAEKVVQPTTREKRLTVQELRDLARIVDSRGQT